MPNEQRRVTATDCVAPLRRLHRYEVGWTKPDPAATTEHKSTPVATNRHSSGTEQHLNRDEEGRRRSERNRTRQTVAAGPPRLPATVPTGEGITSLGGSDDATTSQDGVAGQDSERSDTDTVGQSRYGAQGAVTTVGISSSGEDMSCPRRVNTMEGGHAQEFWFQSAAQGFTRKTGRSTL
ncbi:hypothetical protein HPB47_021321 [Ixodes persulcatus]|uniref:Uncharacterized protein n=1 Tax=Ixodes persulcatus TaxID=34615 RepID=A0AC60QF40_IXOPE|nr:hypothetical protein HPB47_021321 [Ixodes persulcatus]